MNIAESFLIWIVSFFVLFAILYVSYKISYKLGIKKALYRTTYILLSVIFAFVLARFINEELFNMDLSKFGIALSFKGKNYYTVIDFIEEVIVHSAFLNDLYMYVPSLKELLMDFPQLILMPITYVLLFGVFLVMWAPLYFYLSYKRKRRILYDREDNRGHRVWAGILGCVQLVFIISVLLSPLNGLNRIYQNSTNNTLDDKYSSLCDEHAALKKYKGYCDLLEVYNSTVFANIGANGTVSNYVFDSLTKISYQDDSTTLANEASLIIKSGIVLNQSGLLNSVMASSETLDLDLILENNLSDEDIDIMMETLRDSKYSEELLLELQILVTNTLNDLMKNILDDYTFSMDYVTNKDDVINEIKTALKALMIISNTTFVDDSLKAIEIVLDYVYDFPENRKTEETLMKMLIEVIDAVDIDNLEMFVKYISDSKIFSTLMPYFVNRVMGVFGVDFVNTQEDFMKQFDNFMYVVRLIEKYRTKSFLDLVIILNKDELLKVADIIEYVINSPSTQGLVKFLLHEILIDFDEYFPSQFFSIKNWRKEAPILQKVCKLIRGLLREDKIDFKLVGEIFSHTDSEIVAISKDVARQNISFFWKEIVLGIVG